MPATDLGDFANHETMGSSLRAIKLGLAGDGMCFLCGGLPSTGKGEHIFPKWLQRKHNLWDQKINLLNGTLIPYRNATIHCCSSCNTKVLSRLERFVQKIVDVNDLVSESSEYYLGVWSFKILIGILFVESRLRRERSDNSSGSIFLAKDLEEIKNIHLILNSLRKRVEFKCLHKNKVPFTIYRYGVRKTPGVAQYNVSTNIVGQSVAMRLGDIGWIAIHDGGLQYEVGPKGPFGLAGKSLHPYQFDEIAARVHYKSALRCATHFYLMTETPNRFHMAQAEVTPYRREILQDGSIRIFDEWDERILAKVIQNYTGVENAYDEDTGFCRTLIVDENRNLRKI